MNICNSLSWMCCFWIFLMSTNINLEKDHSKHLFLWMCKFRQYLLLKTAHWNKNRVLDLRGDFVLFGFYFSTEYFVSSSSNLLPQMWDPKMFGVQPIQILAISRTSLWRQSHHERMIKRKTDSERSLLFAALFTWLVMIGKLF